MLFSVLKSFGFNKTFMIIVALFLSLQFYHISYWYFILFIFILADYFESVKFFCMQKAAAAFAAAAHTYQFTVLPPGPAAVFPSFPNPGRGR